MGKKLQYGGQAVIEGVMMKGRENVAIAVRKPDNSIVVEERVVKSITSKIPFLKWPFIRGVFILIETMILGMQALTYSANQAAESEAEELSKTEMIITILIAVVAGLLLFVVAPTTLAKFLEKLIKNSFLLNLVEGIIRIAIFFAYIVAISRMKDIQRVFQYHGAEHKVIWAYEMGEDLTVPNAQKYGTLHPRCGTSFLLIVMIMAILIFSLLGKQVLLWRIISRVILFPVVAAVSYEIIKFTGTNCNNPIIKWLIKPGLWLQKLTTRQPDDSQVEVAIASLTAVLAREGR